VFLSLEHVGQSPEPSVFFLTAAATLSNSELKTSLALSAVAKLISKANPVTFHDKLDHAASSRESWYVANR